MAESGILRNNKFSNILCTATTIVTSDGYAFYTSRSRQVSSDKGYYTSAIAENIHQQKDESLTNSQEDELPAPFKTVIRGLEEEVSPAAAEYVKTHPHCVFLLGIAFDLQGLRPDLLFMILFPMTRDTVLKMIRERPGKDFFEGKLQAVSIIDNFEALNSLLADPLWIPGGKASLIRTLEFLQVLQHSNPDVTFEDIARKFLSGKALLHQK